MTQVVIQYLILSNYFLKAITQPRDLLDINAKRCTENDAENIVSVVGKDVRFACTGALVGLGDGYTHWYFQAWKSLVDVQLGVKHNRMAGEISVDDSRFSWDSSDLVIAKVKISDGGSYRCAVFYAHNNGERGEHTCSTLTVIELPDHSNPVKSRAEFIVETSASITLTCNSQSPGTELTAWFDEDFNVLIYDGVKMSDNPRIKVAHSSQRNMFIDNLDLTDSQMYYCIGLGASPLQWFEYLLHIRGCPPSTDWHVWKEVRSVKKCYGTEKSSTKRFGAAEVWCRKQGGHLAMPKSRAENYALKHLNLIHNNEFYIGITDFEYEDEYRWLDGSYLRGDQSLWGTDEPDNWYDEDCAVLMQNGHWGDRDCDERHFFICETSNYDFFRNKKLQRRRCPNPSWVYFDGGGYCYNRISVEYTWSQANRSCTELNAKLAMPKTAREHRFVKNMLMESFGRNDQNNREVWIGLKMTNYDTGHEWIDGIVEHWIFWGPSRSRNGHFCNTMDPEGRINARRCSDLKYVICQKPQNIVPDPSPAVSCGRTAIPSKVVSGYSVLQDNNIARFLGGQFVDIEEVPWFVRMSKEYNGGKSGMTTCGGVLVGPRLVLTAAHCLTDDDGSFLTATQIFVSLGSESKEKRSARREAVHNVRRPDRYVDHDQDNFRWDSIKYDIAVLELKRSMDIESLNIRAACLPYANYPAFTTPYTGYDCMHCGAGGSGQYLLSTCKLSPSDFFAPDYGQIRIRENSHKCGPTYGDSGAPLLCRKNSQWVVAGTMCCIEYGVKSQHVDVKTHLDWIEDTLQSKCSNIDPIYICS